jgi:Na+-transporting NADH:ubiquinone oxidoreductase subunit A
MKFVGGYNILLEGKPSGEITGHTAPDVLHLPLFSGSLDFSALQVENGDSVKQGQILAEDPVNYFVPLLAPLDGTVNLEALERHITLENISSTPNTLASDSDEKIDQEDRIKALLRLGVWSFMAKVDSGRIPDPETEPEALIIPITRFEPFFPSPDVFLKDNIDRFVDGLGLIHQALDDVEAHIEVKTFIILPEDMSEVGSQLRLALKEKADWARLIEVPERYPNESPALIAQLLEINPDSAWTLDAQAVLGAEQALNHGRPHVTRVVSVGGPAVAQPSHFRLPIGYPLSSLMEHVEASDGLRIIDGGVLTGRRISEAQKGLDAECVSLTVLKENKEREVLAYAKAGFKKQSYSRTFASVLKPFFREKLTTAVRGEARPCVFCGNCEDVCPAGLIPHVIYRYLVNDREEDADRVGFNQCVECGLCSYVCLSKIEHLQVFREEKRKSTTELVDV